MARKAVVVVPAPEVAVLSAVDIAKAMVADAKAILAQAKLDAKPVKVAKPKVTPEWRVGFDAEYEILLNEFTAAGLDKGDAKQQANKAIFKFITASKRAVPVTA